MPYIGRGPAKSGAFRILDDVSGSFNGSTTSFALTVGSTALTVGLPETLLIAVDGVIQEAGSAYTISGSNIVFTAAPQADATFWGVELGDVGGLADRAVTQSASNNSTRIATTAYVDTQVATENQISEMNDVTLSSIGSGEVLKWNGTAWVNNTLAELGVLPVANPTFTGTLTVGSAAITEAELEILDGATVTTTELNLLDALDRGSILYGNASGVTTVLGQGGANTVLTSDGTDISWAAAAGGGDLSFGGDTFGANKVVGSNDAYDFAFETNGVTRLHIESAGKVGIGTTGPTELLSVNGTGTSITGTTVSTFSTQQDFNPRRGVMLGYDSSGQIGIISATTSSAAADLAFWSYNSGWSEKMRLKADGVLNLYHTAGGARMNIKDTDSSGTGANGFIRWQDQNDAQVGYIGKGSSNGTMQFANESAAATTFSTSGLTRLTIAANGTLSGSATNDISDQRIKENIEDTTVGLAEVLQLRPVKYNFMAGKGWGEPGQKFYGFLAQEVEEIIPEAVETADIDIDEEQAGAKRDPNGIPDLKSVTMTQITTALVKAVQELNAKIDALGS